MENTILHSQHMHTNCMFYVTEELSVPDFSSI